MIRLCNIVVLAITINLVKYFINFLNGIKLISVSQNTVDHVAINLIQN